MFFKDGSRRETRNFSHNIFQKFCYWMRSVLLLSILTGTRAQNLDVSGAEIKEGESATLSCTPRGSGTPESGMIEIHS